MLRLPKWKRHDACSQVSDDSRFEITVRDASRRTRWVELLDTATGKRHDVDTIREAKETAAEIVTDEYIDPAAERVQVGLSPAVNDFLRRAYPGLTRSAAVEAILVRVVREATNSATARRPAR